MPEIGLGGSDSTHKGPTLPQLKVRQPMSIAKDLAPARPAMRIDPLLGLRPAGSRSQTPALVPLLPRPSLTQNLDFKTLPETWAPTPIASSEGTKMLTKLACAVLLVALAAQRSLLTTARRSSPWTGSPCKTTSTVRPWPAPWSPRTRGAGQLLLDPPRSVHPQNGSHTSVLVFAPARTPSPVPAPIKQ